MGDFYWAVADTAAALAPDAKPIYALAIGLALGAIVLVRLIRAFLAIRNHHGARP